jgi:hypothetical protein
VLLLDKIDDIHMDAFPLSSWSFPIVFSKRSRGCSRLDWFHLILPLFLFLLLHLLLVSKVGYIVSPCCVSLYQVLISNLRFCSLLSYVQVVKLFLGSFIFSIFHLAHIEMRAFQLKIDDFFLSFSPQFLQTQCFVVLLEGT